mmetsp:Transcript_46432/g.52438  ORF Transcript_46432/g.52438 Transcript_46432/m.52438 type:complete len:957 (-) Transcript_46432:2879-5749(-)
MSFSDTGNSISGNNSKSYERQRRSHQFYQLGAPALLYEGNRTDNSHYRIAPRNIPTDNAKHIYEAYKSILVERARWQYSIDVDKLESITVPDLTYGKRNNRTAKAKYKNSSEYIDKDEDKNERKNNCSEKSIEGGEEKLRSDKRWIDEKQERDRLVMLLDNDNRVSRHKVCLQNYASYDHPYVDAKIESRDSKRHAYNKGCRLTTEPKIDPVIYSKSQEFSINHQINSDPSYLAPFDMDSIKEATNDNGVNFRKKLHFDPPERLSRGNSILSVPCPCRPCSTNNSKQSYVLLHPKGYCMERLCITNLVPPISEDNDGDIKNINKKKIRNINQFRWDVIATHPNEVSLDDTILEIQQCGTWNVDNPQCIFSVRTGTHISVVSITCRKLEFEGHPQYSSNSTLCWGCYVLEEIERLDYRSLSPKLPSFRPVSLASHPRYGNAFAPSKFAFVSHSMRETASTYNVIHSCFGTKEKFITKRHDIANVKSISLIDFSNTNPMCLWSAASSYIRPALSPGAISKMQGQTKSPFGLGSSLFTIDLRSNSATFQWSPSAEEMTTEGVHSINGILTDWTRDNTLWVTSTSAGKTWEIDGRMPCQAVNTWSLTALCEASRDITVPRKAFLGENSLLTKPVSNHNDIFDEMSRLDDSPLVKVDTDYRAKGIHLFQKPLHKPRFQTDSLECIASPGIQCTEDEETSIATSSFFGLTDVSDDVYICGISSIRFPVGSFVDSNEDDVWPKYLEHKMKILCTLTMSNNGDIHSHSLLECNGDLKHDCRRFDGLPIGTRAIRIPKELDGRTKFLTNGHWKPTGGMNINLFLSNLYPVPCNTIIPRVNDDDDHNEILLNKSKRSRIDCSIEVAEIKRMKNKSGLMISEEDGPHAMICNKSSLIMPVSHEIGRATIYAAGREVDNDGINDVMNDNVRSASEYAGLERTDLSRNTIQNTLKGWDSMSESEQDDYI